MSQGSPHNPFSLNSASSKAAFRQCATAGSSGRSQGGLEAPTGASDLPLHLTHSQPVPLSSALGVDTLDLNVKWLHSTQDIMASHQEVGVQTRELLVENTGGKCLGV